MLESGLAAPRVCTLMLFIVTACVHLICVFRMLREVTHVVLDEVHERSIQSDFLTIVLKDILPHRLEKPSPSALSDNSGVHAFTCMYIQCVHVRI